mgnify:CR=1 FL=1
MPKPRKSTGEKNLISANLIEYRKRRNYSQRMLAYKLQLNGYDMDKNVITRIETNKRYVTDIELKALCEVLEVSYEELIDGTNPCRLRTKTRGRCFTASSSALSYLFVLCFY